MVEHRTARDGLTQQCGHSTPEPVPSHPCHFARRIRMASTYYPAAVCLGELSVERVGACVEAKGALIDKHSMTSRRRMGTAAARQATRGIRER